MLDQRNGLAHVGLLAHAFVVVLLAAVPAWAGAFVTGGGTVTGQYEGIERDASGTLHVRVSGRRVPLDDLAYVDLRPLPPAPAREGVLVHLTNGDILAGEVVGGDASKVVLDTARFGEVSVVLERLRALFVPQNLPAGPAGHRFRVDLSAEDNTTDVAVNASGTRVAGTVDRIDPGTLQFQAQGLGGIPIPFGELRGVLLALIEKAPALAPPVAVFHLTDGSRISGTLLDGTAESFHVATLFREELSIPSEIVGAIHLPGLRADFLSDRTPDDVKAVGYFGDNLPAWDTYYKPDSAWEGGPLMIGGRVVPKGIGAHSRCELVYRLTGGAYDRFETEIGLDDSARVPGVRASVRFLVDVDGVRKHDSGVVAAEDGSRAITVSLEGAKELRLIVDFGDNADVRGRADWVWARLVRASRK